MSSLKTGLLFALLSTLAACGPEAVGLDGGSSEVDGGGAGGGGGATGAPSVLSSAPSNNAAGVQVNTTVTASFTHSMDPTTLNTTTFTLKEGADAVSGVVTYVAATNTATFVPSSALVNGALYTAMIGTGAKDESGNSLAAEHSWSFTTINAVLGPTVSSTVPVNGGIGAAHNSSITATFTKPMNATTLSATNFTVKQGTTVVPGTVSFDAVNQTATFDPAAALGQSLVYTATISTAVRDTAGLALAADHVWSFTTAANTAAPTVTGTTPLNVATGVSISKRPTAIFSKAMKPTTLTAQTFSLKQGLNAVPGTVAFDGLTNTATFTPTNALGLNMTYTATVTTGAKDTGNTGLANDFVWSFTTAACGQATVNLRSAAGFAILGGSTVTSTGQTQVTGDLGVSPGTAVTGFPAGTVVGNKHVGNPTAARAIADLTTAYNDAAGRTLCPVSKAGNLGGQTLFPGLYKSTSSLAVSSGDLTLDAQGDGDAVFVFQMASTLTTTAGRQVILTNGAKSSNVFWQVGTSATFGTTSAFKGTIMADQSITFNTGATLNGRALARIGAVAMDSNTVVKPAP